MKRITKTTFPRLLGAWVLILALLLSGCSFGKTSTDSDANGASASDDAGTTDTAAVAEQIMAIRDYPGLSGYDMSYNDQKEMNKGIYVFEVENGTFVRVK